MAKQVADIEFGVCRKYENSAWRIYASGPDGFSKVFDDLGDRAFWNLEEAQAEAEYMEREEAKSHLFQHVLAFNKKQGERTE